MLTTSFVMKLKLKLMLKFLMSQVNILNRLPNTLLNIRRLTRIGPELLLLLMEVNQLQYIHIKKTLLMKNSQSMYCPLRKRKFQIPTVLVIHLLEHSWPNQLQIEILRLLLRLDFTSQKRSSKDQVAPSPRKTPSIQTNEVGSPDKIFILIHLTQKFY